MWMLLILLFFLLFLLFALVFFYFLVTALSKSTFIWRSKFIEGIALTEKEYPEFVYDYENRKLYFTKFAFRGTKYSVTYLVKLLGFQHFGKYCLAVTDWTFLFYFADIYWSPLYHYTETYLFDCFRSIRKGTFCKDNFCLRVIFSIGLFCLSFLISIFLVNFSSEYLVYLRLLLLFLVLILSCLVLYNKFKHVKVDQFVLTVWFYRILSVVVHLLDLLPKLINNLVNLFINISIFVYVLAFLQLNVPVINVLMIYIIFLSLWSIIIKVCNLLKLSIGYGLHDTQSIFFIPTGSLLIYILYSFLWWLQFIYKAIRLRDISLLWQYLKFDLKASYCDHSTIFLYVEHCEMYSALAAGWFYGKIFGYSGYSTIHFYTEFERLLYFGFVNHKITGFSFICIPESESLVRETGFTYKLTLEEFKNIVCSLRVDTEVVYDMEKVLILEEKGVDSEEKL